MDSQTTEYYHLKLPTLKFEGEKKRKLCGHIKWYRTTCHNAYRITKDINAWKKVNKNNTIKWTEAVEAIGKLVR